MIRTEGSIVTDIFKYVKASALGTAINGEVYKSVDRPLNSKLEDIVIKPVGNVPRQRQECIVNCNIYVPDFMEDGQYNKNGDRCDELELIATQVLEVFRLSDARVTLDTQHTYKVDNAHAHVINNRLSYQIINE